MRLSVIILSYAIDEEVYQMNVCAIESLYASQKWREDELEVLLMESNKESKYTYDRRVRVMIPEEKFGFHRFFNIGLDNTSGEFVAFCNNDIVFMPGWWSAIMEEKRKHPKFMCFSPADSSYPMMAEEIAKDKDYIIGWENKRHFAAWCFVWERKIFDTIGRFDDFGARARRNRSQVEDVRTLFQQGVGPPPEGVGRRGPGGRVERVPVEVDDSHDFRCAGFHILLTLQVECKDNTLC